MSTSPAHPTEHPVAPAGGHLTAVAGGHLTAVAGPGGAGEVRRGKRRNCSAREPDDAGRDAGRDAGFDVGDTRRLQQVARSR